MQFDRRSALAAGAVAASGILGAGNVEAQEDEAEKPKDRDFVMAAGMTAKEADCWAAIAKAAGEFFALPELHPRDRQEVETAVHVIQNKLLSRPTYREYLKRAKAAYEARGK